MFQRSGVMAGAKVLAIGAAALVLASCGGGGGGSNTCVNLDPGRDPNLPSCGNVIVDGTIVSPTIALALTNASGNPITAITPDQPGTLQVIVRTGAGIVVPNTAVTFTTTDSTGIFVPASATALTNNAGVATIVIPAGAQTGAFTVTATANVGAIVAKGTTSYTTSFPSLTLGPVAISPANLSAGGTASLSVTVRNGSSAYLPAQAVTFSSPCVAGGKATISSPVTTVNGIATTSYIDKGCGGTDLITASTSLGGATATSTGTITVSTAAAGQVTFVSALPQNIALKGTGGAGRQESSTVTFKVLDSNGNPVSGQLVNFALNTSAGGLTLNPTSGTSGADGTVTTVVSSGTVNTPIRVTASLPGTAISTLSDQLVVSTGVPDQDSFSLSTEIFNVEGMNYDGCTAPIGSRVTVRLADHFNNPAPDGTAVSFTAEGGSIDASCLTGLVETTLTNGTVITQKGIPGACSVRFCSANPRPVDGRVTILAYALGEESFTDANGNNLFDEGETYDDLVEPFLNKRAITSDNANGIDDVWANNNKIRASSEQYIDSNGNGAWNEMGDDQYNGVLSTPIRLNTTHVRSSLVQVLSTSEAAITILNPAALNLNVCTDGVAFSNGANAVRLAIRDRNPTIFAGNSLSGNILPAGTTIAFTSSNGTLLTNGTIVVPNTNNPSSTAWTYDVLLQSDATQGPAANGSICTNPVKSGLLNITVTTPSGVITTGAYNVTD